MTLRAWIVTLLPLIGVATLVFVFGGGEWTALRALGLGASVVGFALLTLARLQLGSAFSLSPRASKLVTTGLYARLRHPVYVFSLLGISGLILYFGELTLLAVVPVIALAQLVRARREDRVLEQHFGDEYRAYRDKTWF
ncbi:MAG: isoprenylcysteine carboxylmethyltransferase family protein [Myxococcales bacterium]|nr:isoprenylcysteine carboxylmethyltransferase family protein [Myxococcales bacterium]